MTPVLTTFASGSGWGYRITQSGQPWVEQPYDPSTPGLAPWPTEAQAHAAGLAVLQQLAPDAPTAKVVMTTLTVDDPHKASSLLDLVAKEATTLRGAVLDADVEIQGQDGKPLPITRAFRMPLLASDGREDLILASFANGKAKVRIPCDQSGTWKITESGINQRLEPSERLAFAGFTIFVGRA